MPLHQQVGLPLTVSQRLERLTSNLEVLRDKLKDSIAAAIGTAVAEAVHDAIRGLLGSEDVSSGHREDHWPLADERSWDNRRWDRFEEDSWPQSRQFDKDPDYQDECCNRAGNSRIRNAIGAALTTSMWWLRQQKNKRPVLTTSVVALAAGAIAFFWGPALAAGVGVLASITGLILTADNASQTAGSLTTVATG
jgi:hypothetical protein